MLGLFSSETFERNGLIVAFARLGVLMTNRISCNASPENWRKLYVAALFEADNDKMSERIAAAEEAIVARGRELFAATSDTVDEDQSLDDALYALRALQHCLENRSRAA